jgi:hypothetical protein
MQLERPGNESLTRLGPLMSGAGRFVSVRLSCYAGVVFHFTRCQLKLHAAQRLVQYVSRYAQRTRTTTTRRLVSGCSWGYEGVCHSALSLGGFLA